MKKIVLAISLFFCYSVIQAQSENLFCEQLSETTRLIHEAHYEPKALDDDFSEAVFELFIKDLDPDAIFFTQRDYQDLQQDVHQLDDYIQEKNCDFIDKYVRLLQAKFDKTEQLLSSLQTAELTFDKTDVFQVLTEPKPFRLSDEEDYKQFWKRKVTYELLENALEKDSIYDKIVTKFQKNQQEYQQHIIERNLCKLSELKQRDGSIKKFVEHTFLNAVLHYQDPHSYFFTDSEKTGFERSIAQEQESFGFSTSKNDKGEIVIRYITPGSPAYKNANFEVDDIIKKLSSHGDTLATYCISDEDVQEFTRAKTHKTIVFTLKKKSGRIETVKLTRSLQKVEENSITGFILSGEQTIGYIKLPSFYTDLESPRGLGVANDVAKQVYKLQSEAIDGLIVDLRFNGGGSMKEAADLSGMFIDKGPLSIITSTGGDSYTIRDANRGSLFYKPMVVLVNHFSASASEFFAAAMQDYNRAIIMGASTHGKASAQVILPLNDQQTELGFVKITVEKFYRSTGKSHQGKGVIPDIVLPDLYDGLQTAEYHQPYALEADETLVTLQPRPLPQLPIAQLKAKSKQRVQSNSMFTSISTTNKKLVKEYFKEYQQQLSLESVYQNDQTYRNLWKPYVEASDAFTASFTVSNSASTQEVISYNPEAAEMNELLIDEIREDVYIQEAFNTLHDYIQLKTN